MISKRTRVSILYFIIVIATLLLRISVNAGLFDNSYTDVSDYFTCIVQIVIFGGISIVGYFLFAINDHKNNKLTFKEDFGFKKISLKTFLISIVVGILMVIVSTGISFVWQIMLSSIGYTRVSSSTDYSSIGVLIKELIFVAVFPGIFEEIANRGLLYAGYREYKWKFVVLSGLMFSLMHQNIVQTGYTFFDGCIMALMMYYTGSIFPGIIMHFLNNAIAVFLGYIEQNGGAFNFINVISNWFSTTMQGYVVAVLCFILAGILLLLILTKIRKNAVSCGTIEDSLKLENVKPLRTDFILVITIITGIVATIFSLVWGIMR